MPGEKPDWVNVSYQGRVKVKLRSQKSAYAKDVSVVTHVLQAIIHITYNSDGRFTIQSHFGESGFKFR